MRWIIAIVPVVLIGIGLRATPLRQIGVGEAHSVANGQYIVQGKLSGLRGGNGVLLGENGSSLMVNGVGSEVREGTGTAVVNKSGSSYVMVKWKAVEESEEGRLVRVFSTDGKTPTAKLLMTGVDMEM